MLAVDVCPAISYDVSVWQWPISSVQLQLMNSPSNNPQSLSNHQEQFVISVVGWSTLRHLEFSYISADRLTPENWLTVDWSIRQFWQIGWWRTDHIWIMLNIYSLSTCGQADDAMLDTFFVSKLKQWCILTGDGLAIAKLFM